MFVAPKLHEVARPVYTGDFCRATQCNFCRAEVASSFEHVRNLMQLHGDKNCIELRDKNRLCKRAFRSLARIRLEGNQLVFITFYNLLTYLSYIFFSWFYFDSKEVIPARQLISLKNI